MAGNRGLYTAPTPILAKKLKKSYCTVLSLNNDSENRCVVQQTQYFVLRCSLFTRLWQTDQSKNNLHSQGVLRAEVLAKW